MLKSFINAYRFSFGYDYTDDDEFESVPSFFENLRDFWEFFQTNITDQYLDLLTWWRCKNSKPYIVFFSQKADEIFEHFIVGNNDVFEEKLVQEINEYIDNNPDMYDGISEEEKELMEIFWQCLTHLPSLHRAVGLLYDDHWKDPEIKIAIRKVLNKALYFLNSLPGNISPDILKREREILMNLRYDQKKIWLCKVFKLLFMVEKKVKFIESKILS